MFLKRRQQSRFTCWLAITGERMTNLGKGILRCQGTPNIPWIPWRMWCMGWSRDNRPFTDAVAILNLLDLRSVMGCPGGTHSVFTLAFWAKWELQCLFLGKDAIIFTSKHGTTIFFSHYNLFLGKLKEKLARKACVNTERVYRIVLMTPGHLIILLKSN